MLSRDCGDLLEFRRGEGSCLWLEFPRVGHAELSFPFEPESATTAFKQQPATSALPTIHRPLSGDVCGEWTTTLDMNWSNDRAIGCKAQTAVRVFSELRPAERAAGRALAQSGEIEGAGVEASGRPAG